MVPSVLLTEVLYGLVVCFRLQSAESPQREQHQKREKRGQGQNDSQSKHLFSPELILLWNWQLVLEKIVVYLVLEPVFLGLLRH